MLDIEKFIKQAERFNDCVKNIQAAKLNLERQSKRHYSNEEDDSDIVYARDMITSAEETLVGQLKLMNIQNEEELKS